MGKAFGSSEQSIFSTRPIPFSELHLFFLQIQHLYGIATKKTDQKKQENLYFLFICHKIIAFFAHFSYKSNRFVSKLFCFFGLLCIGQACYNEFTRQDKITKISQRTNSLTLCIPFEGGQPHADFTGTSEAA